MINYWARLIQYDENRYNYILYNLMLSKSNDNGITFKWLDFIKDILNECGLNRFGMIKAYITVILNG